MPTLKYPLFDSFSLSIDRSSLFPQRKIIFDDQRARGVGASKLTLLKGVILNKIPFLPLFYSEFGLGVCEAATLVHVWEVTRSAWGRRESGGMGMGMGMGMGIWGVGGGRTCVSPV